MKRAVARAYARAGLLGNPSDGYFGKIIAISVKNFAARVSLVESKSLRIIPARGDLDIYRDRDEFIRSINLFGYYGGERLIKAGLKIFFDYCRRQNIGLEKRNFTVSYESTIPRQVGLGGSSAIIVATMRALMRFFGVSIPREILPTLVLQAEVGELGINAGFMDRVIQVYEGCVFMDLDRRLIEERGYGRYERLDPAALPPLFLAYRPDLGKVSGVVLNEIRRAYDRGDRRVIGILEKIAALAEKGLMDYRRGDFRAWPAMMNENFDLRSRIMTISESNMEMIRIARGCGASAKFAGSGGSIIGIYQDERMYTKLRSELGKVGAKVIKPRVE